MIFILVVMKVALSTIFISAGSSKVRKVEEHIAIVKDYRILPKRLVRFSATLEIVVEILAGSLLFFGLFQTWVLLIMAVLLVVYCLAIVINLVRGRKEISCGCGGLAGQHSLSWWLVIRNMLLIIFCLRLMWPNFITGNVNAILTSYLWKAGYTIEVLDAAFLFWSVTLIFLIVSKFRQVQRYINNLVGR